MKRYQQVAAHIIQQMEAHYLRPGDLLPSLRNLGQQLSVSKNTIIRAYMQLEDAGLIEPRNRSGFVVVGLPDVSRQLECPEPRRVKLGATPLLVVAAAADPERIPLGSAHPAIQFPACRDFYKIVAREAYRQAGSEKQNSHYVQPPGLLELRQQLVRRVPTKSFSMSADDIIVTSGAQEAISLSLLALAQAGDINAIETPCFYGNLQCIEALGMKVVEIPSDKTLGIDLELLESALKQWAVKAIMVNPSHNNPLGFNMPLSRKSRLLALAEQFDLPIIEDDTFGGLHFEQKADSLKSIDSTGRVIYCNSLSKTLHSDIRLGWVVAGRYFEQINYMKYVATMASPGLIQLGAARFLEGNRYERHLRTVRRVYHQRYQLILEAIHEYWPDVVTVSCPVGGFLLWITMPPEVDGDLIFQQAHQRKISITPGSLFSSDNRFKNCMRLNFATYRPDPKYQHAMQTLGTLIRQQLEK